MPACIEVEVHVTNLRLVEIGGFFWWVSGHWDSPVRLE